MALQALLRQVAALSDDVGLVLGGLRHNLGLHQRIDGLGEHFRGAGLVGPALFLQTLYVDTAEAHVQVVLQVARVECRDLGDGKDVVHSSNFINR